MMSFHKDFHSHCDIRQLKMKSITLVFTLISVIHCQRVPLFNIVDGGRIVGGMEVCIEETPYQVSLQYYDSPICGGAILTDKFVITAAHCVFGRPARTLFVRVGTSNKYEGGVVHDVAVAQIHPSYNRATYDYDVAILQLAVPIKIDDRKTQEISMPRYGEVIPEKTLVLVSGWGENLISQ